MCANRFGKTMCGAAELAFHLTGGYPEWWNGKRFDKPVRAWAAGVTAETTRDVLQEKLIGPPFREVEWGTGMIPKAAIAGVATSRGIPAAIDTVTSDTSAAVSLRFSSKATSVVERSGRAPRWKFAISMRNLTKPSTAKG
jgi:hypothetical protein